MAPIPVRPVIAPVPHHNHQHHCTCESKSEERIIRDNITYGIGYGLVFIGLIIALIGLRIGDNKNKNLGWRIEQVGIFIMFLAMFSPIIISPFIIYLCLK